MTARRILATAALCTLMTGAAFAQVTGQTIWLPCGGAAETPAGWR
jgi:hypothetical protein